MVCLHYGKRKYTYSLAFYSLTLTSVVVHGIYFSTVTVIIDKIAICSIVILGLFYLLRCPSRVIIYTFVTFVTVTWIYYYGYMTNFGLI